MDMTDGEIRNAIRAIPGATGKQMLFYLKTVEYHGGTDCLTYFPELINILHREYAPFGKKIKRKAKTKRFYLYAAKRVLRPFIKKAGYSKERMANLLNPIDRCDPEKEFPDNGDGDKSKINRNAYFDEEIIVREWLQERMSSRPIECCFKILDIIQNSHEGNIEDIKNKVMEEMGYKARREYINHCFNRYTKQALGYSMGFLQFSRKKNLNNKEIE